MILILLPKSTWVWRIIFWHCLRTVLRYLFNLNAPVRSTCIIKRVTSYKNKQLKIRTNKIFCNIMNVRLTIYNHTFFSGWLITWAASFCWFHQKIWTKKVKDFKSFLSIKLTTKPCLINQFLRPSNDVYDLKIGGLHFQGFY